MSPVTLGGDDLGYDLDRWEWFVQRDGVLVPEWDSERGFAYQPQVPAPMLVVLEEDSDSLDIHFSDGEPLRFYKVEPPSLHLDSLERASREGLAIYHALWAAFPFPEHEMHLRGVQVNICVDEDEDGRPGDGVYSLVWPFLAQCREVEVLSWSGMQLLRVQGPCGRPVSVQFEMCGLESRYSSREM